ncbi:hypothetical protein pb186bvf_001338 [Paramecium bursaria]
MQSKQSLSDQRGNRSFNSDINDIKNNCKLHAQNVLILWCKGCKKSMCQKCVADHSVKVQGKQHVFIELSTLKTDVQKDAQDMFQMFDELLQKIEPEYNLEDQQNIGLQILYKYQNIINNQVNMFFQELKNVLISLTSNHSNLVQKESLYKSIQRVQEDLDKYMDPNMAEVLIQEYYNQDFRSLYEQLKNNTQKFMDKTKREYRRPTIKIRDNFIREIPNLLSNIISITLHRPFPFTNQQLPRILTHKQSMIQPTDRVLQRKQSAFTPSNLTQSQVLGQSYVQVMQERNMEQRIAQPNEHADEIKEIHPIFQLEQSKIRYLHSLIDETKLFIHDLQTATNQIIHLPESAEIPDIPRTTLSDQLVLYISGGRETKDQIPSDKFYQFDNKYGLKKLNNLIYGVYNHSICFAKGSLYFFGGKNEEVMSKCFRYIIQSEHFEVLDDMNHARSNHGCCTFETDSQFFIYVFFGVNKYGSMEQSVEKYDLNERSWSQILITNLIPGIIIIQPSALQINQQQILIFGGIYKNTLFSQSNKTLIYNSYNDTIDNLGQLIPYLGQQCSQCLLLNESVYSIHYHPDSQQPKYSEFMDIFQILQISNKEIKIKDVINTRQMVLKKFKE